MKDILGSALLDYYNGNTSAILITETSISEADELPVSYFFRSYSEMPPMEQKALQLAKGRVLDVGCGAGSHSLYLQEKGLNVTAIDTSEGAVKVAKLRGVKDVKQTELLRLTDEKFDSVLLLMNGTGIFEKIEFVSAYLQYLKSLLAPGGQILIDSSDLKYMYDEGEDGGIWVQGDAYYGELEFIVKYKDLGNEVFDWLYLDERIFESACHANKLKFEVVSRGENFDYLARITT